MNSILRTLFAVPMLVLGLGAASPASAQDTVIYYHTDAIGSVRAITNNSGAVVARYDYMPFGELPPTNPPQAAEVRQFAGKERDSNTELDYFGARYHRAVSGRFTTVDPVLNLETALTDPQLWNRYSYAANRPFTMIDPDGREAGYIYLSNGQIRAPISAVTPTFAAVWGGTIAAGGAALAGAGGVVAAEAISLAVAARSPLLMTAAMRLLTGLSGTSDAGINKAALLDDAVAAGRNGVSAAGRALQSHSTRSGSWLEGLAQGGNGALNTATARRELIQILQSGRMTRTNHQDWGNIITFRLKDGRGAVWSEDGKFITFLERYTKELR